MNSFINDILEKIATEASKLACYIKKPTVTSRETQTTVRLIFPGELAKHAVSEGTMTMELVDFPASRSRAQCKLQDDALAQTLLGKLCVQVPEVFQTHVMPHLTNEDLCSLAFLGGEPRRLLRGSSRAAAVLSRYDDIWASKYAVMPVNTRRLLRVIISERRLHERLHPQLLPSRVWELFHVLDNFVGVDPNGRAYCKMCRSRFGTRFGKTNLTTLPALRNHASLQLGKHEDMRDAIDA